MKDSKRKICKKLYFRTEKSHKMSCTRLQIFKIKDHENQLGAYISKTVYFIEKTQLQN